MRSKIECILEENYFKKKERKDVISYGWEVWFPVPDMEFKREREKLHSVFSFLNVKNLGNIFCFQIIEAQNS